MQHILQMEGKIECTHVWSIIFFKKDWILFQRVILHNSKVMIQLLVFPKHWNLISVVKLQ